MYLPKVILLLFVNKIIGLVTAGPQRCSICSKIQGSTVNPTLGHLKSWRESIPKLKTWFWPKIWMCANAWVDWVTSHHFPIAPKTAMYPFHWLTFRLRDCGKTLTHWPKNWHNSYFLLNSFLVFGNEDSQFSGWPTPHSHLLKTKFPLNMPYDNFLPMCLPQNANKLWSRQHIMQW